jgi:enoyl-CoA hydratase/carnithine racemase
MGAGVGIGTVLTADQALRAIGGGLTPETVGWAGGQSFLAVTVDGDPLLEELSAVLRSVPCVTVGVADAGADLSAPPDFDLLVTVEVAPPRPWVGCPDPVELLDHLSTVVHRSPAAAIALAQLLRFSGELALDDALVAESFVYSMLQSGPDYHRWLGQRGPLAHRHQSEPTVLVHRQGSALELTLNRPQVRNAYDAAMRDELVASLQLASVDASLTSVSLSGAGPAFCSGGDLSEFGSVPDPTATHLIRTTRNAAPWLARCATRTVVTVHGACVGAGVEIPAFAAQVVARPDAFFQLPEVGMGLVPGAGGTVSLPRRIGRQRTAYLGISGRPVDAATALDWGLVDRIETASAP